jgi:hypothetical protein
MIWCDLKFKHLHDSFYIFFFTFLSYIIIFGQFILECNGFFLLINVDIAIPFLVNI